MKISKKNLTLKKSSGRLIVATTLMFFLSVIFYPVTQGQNGSQGQNVIERATATLDGSALESGKKAQASRGLGESGAKGSGVSGSGSGSATKQSPNVGEVASNYTFATNTTASLTDMSTGTTQLLGPNIDDTASALTNIGFDFYFQGARFSQFSINENGVFRLGATAQSSTPYKPLAQAGIPIITAYGADQRTHAGDGKVHFKVTGSAPNRVLTVEWLNNQANFNTGGTADLTYQVRLYETTGVIELVYGSMTMSAAGAADANSRDPNIGFSSSNTVGTVGSVTAAQSGTPAPTFDGTSATAVANLYTAGAITVLTSATNGSRRIFSFTPPTPTAPTGLNFTGVAPTAMMLNWTDSPNETIYAIYRSTDGTNFTFDGTAAQNATSYAASGLNPSTTYFWRVFAVSEGALSTALSGSQMTSPAGIVMSTAAGGNWSNPATWVGGSVPIASDNVTIVDGATVTIDTAAVALNVTVGQGSSGILQYETTTARTLTVGQSVVVSAGGTFQSAATGTVTTHVLSVGTDLTNNGNIDFSTNSNTAGAGITFTGANDASFTLGAASTTDFKQTAGVTLNKGTNNTPVLTFLPGGTVTVLGANAVGFLTITNGTFKLSGANTFSNPVFNAAAYSIPATGGFWMNNANATVVGLNGTSTLTGMFRMSQGTFNIGIATGNSMGFATGSNILVEGGAINATGRFAVSASTSVITYNQSGGTITVCTIGNASTTLANFDLGTAIGSTVNITGGTIIVQLANTGGSGPRDYRHQAGTTGILSVTAGTLQLGNAASGAAKAFNIAGVLPNLVLNNASANHSATFLAPVAFNNISLDITINTGNTLNIGNNVFLMNGATLTNNGTLTANGASSNFVWFLTTAPQMYTGSGTVTAPVTNFAIQSDMGLTIDPASSNIVVGAIRLFSGNLINSNKITLGNGGATTGIVQIGNTTTPTAAGTFDVPFTFNLGTGGETVSYLRTTLTRTTGPEINPTRTLTSMTYDDNDVTHSLTIAGGDLTLASAATALTLTNGHILTGANTLILSSGTATVTRTNGFVDGNFRKTYAAAVNKTFEVGTANGFSPVAVNATAGTFPATFTVKAVQGPQPNILSPQLALQRYWVLDTAGITTADLTFNYLDPTDIPVSATEANFVIFKYDGAFTMPGGTVNTAANTANITGVMSFSDWTLAEPTAPTAIQLASFRASSYDAETTGGGASASKRKSGVLIEWRTGFEVANLGFNIYRQEGENRVRVNPDLIAGSALFVGGSTALTAGRSYNWRDLGSRAGANTDYWLEEIDLNGQSIWHGPVRPTPSSGRQLSSLASGDSKTMSEVSTETARSGVTRPVEQFAQSSKFTTAQKKAQLTLAGQSAVKISVRQAGYYRVGQPELIAAGINPSVDPRLLQLSVNGQEVPIRVSGESDGHFDAEDAVEFYGTGVNTASTDARVYWLVAGAQAGRRIQPVSDEGTVESGSGFAYTVERRDRTVYFSALRNGEAENFFGAVLARDAVDQTLAVEHLDGAGEQATIEVAVQGVTQVPHRVGVEINGEYAGEMLFYGQAEGRGTFAVSHSSLKEGDNTVRLESRGGQNDVSLVNYIRLTYQHTFMATDNLLRVNASGNQEVSINGFSTSDIRVLDVTDPDNVQEVQGSIKRVKATYQVTVGVPGAGARSLLAIAEDRFDASAAVVANQPSSLRQPKNGADLLIITRAEFIPALDPLVALRQSQKLAVAVIDIEDIYDEFSFGQKSPEAVRDFLAYTRASWKRKPQYLLLAGDSSFDAKNYLGLGDYDLVPSKLLDTVYLETASDDWLADFDGDGLADMAVGRLPFRSVDEATRLVSKIVGYEKKGSSASVLLVADLPDGYNFGETNDQLKTLVPGNIRVVDVRRGVDDDATTRQRLIDAINQGQKVVNYVGHGSVTLWRGDLLTSDDVNQLTNADRLPLFVTMTCLNGYFQDPTLDSLAETLLKAERGGAIAVWASSGMTIPGDQSLMDREMFRTLFGTPAGQRLGDLTVKAKAATGDKDVRQTWILFGDPSMRLK